MVVADPQAGWAGLCSELLIERFTCAPPKA
jgi:hypothetical protein